MLLGACYRAEVLPGTSFVGEACESLLGFITQKTRWVNAGLLHSYSRLTWQNTGNIQNVLKVRWRLRGAINKHCTFRQRLSGLVYGSEALLMALCSLHILDWLFSSS